ncbi:hypothetical protein [Acuticoccus sediminis]|uniref:hypothetical protein n=1 Tax=Acuticoccus sediminis TaxID=2184697 RepID=UPI001CFD7C4F|nr:hypothetical protein [Acuticoccus sediminis]
MTRLQGQAAGEFDPSTSRRHSVAANGTLVCAFAAAAALLPDLAHAYVGPGAGLTAIGTVIALFAAVLFAIVGFVWYPVKRLLRGRGSRAAGPSGEADDLDGRGSAQ